MQDEFASPVSIRSRTSARLAKAPLARTLLALATASAMAASIACSDSAPSPADDGLQVFELAIEKRRVAGPDEVIRVRQGQRVKLRWVTDEPTSLHLHGYDIEAAVKPGIPVVWEFEAKATGRFPIEAHGFGHAEDPAPTHDHSGPHDHSAQQPAPAAEPAEKTLLYFEVYPR